MNIENEENSTELNTLADVLSRYMREVAITADGLSRRSNVPKATIVNWLHGTVSRPQSWESLLKIAKALELKEHEADELLEAAKYPSIIYLRQSHLIREQRELINYWQRVNDRETQQTTKFNIKVFISYTRNNTDSATRLFHDLKSAGCEVWLDQISLIPGQEWEREIKNVIANYDIVIVLLSSQAITKRGYFQKEIRLALETLSTIPSGSIYLIPVRLENCKVPDELTSRQWVDLFPEWRSGVDRLIKAIKYQQEMLNKNKM